MDMRRVSRGSFARFLAALLFFAMAGAVALGANPFRGETITPFDLLITQAGWAAVDPAVALRQGERSDALDSRLPQWLEAREQIRSHHLPIWNDLPAGGDVALFNFTAGMFTPAFAVFVLSPHPADGFYLSILLNLTVAGLGMFLFLRRRLSLLAAALGGLTFELCGFHAAWLYWPHVLTSIWAPWLLLSVDYCSERPGFRSSIAVAASTAMVVLGGFPFVGMLILAAGSLYAALALALEFGREQQGPRTRLALMSWYAAGTILGFLLCALPIAGFINWIERFPLGYRHGGTLLGLRDWRLLFPPWAYATQRVESTMYVGFIMSTLAGLGVVMAVARPRKISLLPAFGGILLLIAAGLVFGYMPAALIGRLPGFNSNIWTRAISILDLALIVLGSWALHWIWTREGGLVWPRVLKGALVGLALVQVVEIAFFFRLYNGPVPKSYFYPRTEAIAYMQEHAGPFDNVIADKSFLISGTLGAYGLHEWFAHAFRSPGLRRAMVRMADKPFSSPTSSRLDGSQIDLLSGAMAEFNVRYVVMGSSTDPYALAAAHPAGAVRRPLPPLPAARQWSQAFHMGGNTQLRGISVRMATYRERHLGGSLLLKLFDAGGALLAEKQVSAASIEDNSLVDFYFSQTLALQPGQYHFSIQYDPHGDSRKITAWHLEKGDQSSGLAVNGQPATGVMDYLLHVSPPEKLAFAPVFSGAGVTVYENRACPKGPYLVEELKAAPAPSAGAGIDVVSYRPGRFTLRYDGSRSGFLVVPMAMTNQWHATANGRSLPIELKDELMPAVRVSGPVTITFEYDAEVLALLWPWLFCIALYVGGMLLVGRRLRAA